jgi:hypothetical protein
MVREGLGSEGSPAGDTNKARETPRPNANYRKGGSALPTSYSPGVTVLKQLRHSLRVHPKALKLESVFRQCFATSKDFENWISLC